MSQWHINRAKAHLRGCQDVLYHMRKTGVSETRVQRQEAWVGVAIDHLWAAQQGEPVHHGHIVAQIYGAILQGRT